MNINKITNEYIGIKTLKDWETIFNKSILGYSIYSTQCLNPFSKHNKIYPQHRGVGMYLYYLTISYFFRKSYYFNVFKDNMNWDRNSRYWLSYLVFIKYGRIFTLTRNDFLGDKSEIKLDVREYRLKGLKLFKICPSNKQDFFIELPLL